MRNCNSSLSAKPMRTLENRLPLKKKERKTSFRKEKRTMNPKKCGRRHNKLELKEKKRKSGKSGGKRVITCARMMSSLWSITAKNTD